MQWCDQIVEDGQRLDKMLHKDPQNLAEINEYASKLRDKYYSAGQMSLKQIAAELDVVEEEILELQNNRSSTTEELENKLLVLDKYISSIQFMYESLKKIDVVADLTQHGNYEEESSTNVELDSVSTATEITEGIEVIKNKANKVKVGSKNTKRRSTTVLMDVEMSLFKQQHEEKQLLQYLETKNLKLTASGNIIKANGKKYELGGKNDRKSAVRVKMNSDGIKIAAMRSHEVRIAAKSDQILLSSDVSTSHVSMDSLSKLFKRDLDQDEDEIAVILLKREISLQSGKILTIGYVRNLGILTENELKLLRTMVISPEKSESYETNISEESFISLPESFDDDSEYLKETVGTPLTQALAEICLKKPQDPIQYLGHWLYKYRYNQEVNKQKKKEILELQDIVNKQRLQTTMESAVGYLKIY